MASATPIYTNQALSADAEFGLAPTQTDLSSATDNGISLSATVTSGSIPPYSGREITVYAAFSEQNLNVNTAGLIQSQLMSSAVRFLVRSNGTASGSTSTISKPLGITANYLYTWISHDTLGNAATISVSYIPNNDAGGGGGGDTNIGAILY